MALQILYNSVKLPSVSTMSEPLLNRVSDDTNERIFGLLELGVDCPVSIDGWKYPRKDR